MIINTLHDLLERPFKSFSIEEQRQIMRQGRFTDVLDLSHLEKSKGRKFCSSWFQKSKWLTSNTKNNKLYCWYCVLFPINLQMKTNAINNSNKTWNVTGFDDMRNVTQATKKHEEAREHVYATIKLKLWLSKNEKKGESVECVQKNNIKVKRNKEYLERLIDISTTLVSVDVPFRTGPGNEGPYGSLVHLFKKYDHVVRSQLEQDNNFHGLTPTIQTALIRSMEQALLERIQDEVRAASFFSLIVNEMNSDAEVKHISLAVRYVKDAVPVERFIGLYEVRYGAKAEEIADVLGRALERFNYRQKMVSQSYDGKVAKPTELYCLQQIMKKRQSCAQLVQYYAHDFRILLVQCLNSITDCRLFFATINSFCTLFQNLNLPLYQKSFESIPACITSLKTQCSSILKVLEYITQDEQYESTPHFIAEAVNLLTHLKTFKFMVLVTLFDEYFSQVHQCMTRIKENIFNSKLCRAEITQLIGDLKSYKENAAFNKLTPNISITGPTSADIFTLNEQILDNLVHEIEGRFLDIELVEFFGLLDLNKLVVEGPKNKVNIELFFNTGDSYSHFFEIARLKTELELMYSDLSIVGFGNHGGVGYVKDILKFIHDNDLRHHLPHVYKLLELIVTIPLFTAPLEGRACVLNRIKSYRASSNKQEPVSSLAVLAMEKDLLLEISKGEEWYERVMKYFSALPSTSSIELTNGVSSDGYVADFVKTEFISLPELDIKTEPDML